MSDDLFTELIRDFEFKVTPIGSLECSRQFFDEQLKSIDPEDIPAPYQPYGVPITIIDAMHGGEVHLLNHEGECYKMIKKTGDNWYAFRTTLIGCYIHTYNLALSEEEDE